MLTSETTKTIGRTWAGDGRPEITIGKKGESQMEREKKELTWSLERIL